MKHTSSQGNRKQGRGEGGRDIKIWKKEILEGDRDRGQEAE